MPDNTLATILILISACMHAVWNAILKRTDDKFAAMMCLSGFGGILYLPFLWLAPFPPADLWPWLAASFAIHFVYQLALTKALEMGALTFIYPIARGLGPTLVALFSYFFLAGEMSLAEVAAVLILAVGIFLSTSTKGATGGTARENGILFALLTGAMIAAYTVIDGLAVRRAPTELTYILWSGIGFSPIFISYGLYRRGTKIFRDAVAVWRPGMLAALIAHSGYGIALYAYSIGSLGEVAAIRETSILFALAIGVFWLKETVSRRRLLAVPLIAAGAIMLKLI